MKKSRGAGFVPIESQDTDTFKYKRFYQFIRVCRNRFNGLKRILNSWKQKPRLWASQVDWKLMRGDVAGWTFSVLIEGLTANFATHFLFGVPFNIWGVFAHGIVIQQGLSIYTRLRQNGPITKIFNKNK